MLNPGGDIEDLYRDFAKNYPLKTEDSGWDEFLQKMESAPVTSTPAAKQPGGTRFLHVVKKFGYWAVPAAVVAITASVLVVKKIAEQKASVQPEAAQVYHTTPAQSPKAEKQRPAQQRAVVEPGKAAAEQPGQESNIRTPAEPGLQIEKKAAVASPKTAAAVNAQHAGVKASTRVVDNNKLPVDNTTANPAAALTHAKPAPAEKAGNKTNNNGQMPGIVNAGKKDAGQLQGNIAQPEKKDESGDKKDLAKQQADTATPSTTASLAPADTTVGNPPQHALKDSTKNTWSFNANIPVVKEAGAAATDTAARSPNTGLDDSTSNQVTHADTMLASQPGVLANSNSGVLVMPAKPDRNIDSVSLTQPLVKINTRDRKYFYAGLVAGPDFSSVKFQEVEKTGSAFGVIFGIHLAKNFSVESGILFTSKKYYSGAQYFKPGILTGPDRDDLVSVNGAARFTEIPITARYDIIHKKRLKLFFTGGFSSYFTREEKYDFLFRRLFGYEIRHAEADEPSSNIFSLLHVSTGIEFKINANNALRFEPYIKIPLSGIGAAALPVTSGGFYINYTHSFFR